MPIKQFELPKPNSLIMVMVVIKGPKGEIEATQNFPPSLPIDGVLVLNVFRKLNRKLTIDFKVRMLELE